MKVKFSAVFVCQLICLLAGQLQNQFTVPLGFENDLDWIPDLGTFEVIL